MSSHKLFNSEWYMYGITAEIHVVYVYVDKITPKNNFLQTIPRGTIEVFSKFTEVYNRGELPQGAYLVSILTSGELLVVPAELGEPMQFS